MKKITLKFAPVALLIGFFSAATFGQNPPDLRHRVRDYVAGLDPRAAALQASRWGIFVPRVVDEQRPLVILTHGLDSERECMGFLGKALAQDGFQVGYFAYPDDQPIDESAHFLATQMRDLRKMFPHTPLNLVAHSMGGLVFRSYIEGDEYIGGVDHLILVGTPNDGSTWAKYSLLLKAQEQVNEWKDDPQWHWTWAVTSGLGEAGRDLQPDSQFLQRMKGLSRRAGVRYTIIAGCKHPADRTLARLAAQTAKAVPHFAENWWGVPQCKQELETCAEQRRARTTNCDGPVTLSSAGLEGVNDVVILPADHSTLIYPKDGQPPAALAVIRQRLGN